MTFKSLNRRIDYVNIALKRLELFAKQIADEIQDEPQWILMALLAHDMQSIFQSAMNLRVAKEKVKSPIPEDIIRKAELAERKALALNFALKKCLVEVGILEKEFLSMKKAGGSIGGTPEIAALSALPSI